ncbi:MAG: DNA repair protein RecO [Candidatus Margulisiibacteriota bacterium]
MAIYKTQGIVLGSRPFDETGKLVTMLTRDYGKIRVIAKGAKRLTSKFGGRLEVFTLLEMSLAEGRNLDILSQAEALEWFGPLRADSEKLSAGFYFIRIIDRATVDHQKNFDLFRLLYYSLKKLSEEKKREDAIKYFESNFLKVEGLFRQTIATDILIGEHLGEDVRPWKN